MSADTSRQNTQLVYTTHSPFLINRNFPQRIRLVKKGDAEEGTQFVDMSHIRRYEPVRSALGVDCAQTLFMGATNLVFEGPTDQFIVSELIRFFATPDTVTDYLDLNSIVLVSAESAPLVEDLLAASQWGDEPIPATVVVLDNDEAGRRCCDNIIGKTNHHKPRIRSDFVVYVPDALGADRNQPDVVTIEDLIPRRLYSKAVASYLRDWYPVEFADHEEKISEMLADEIYGANGLARDTKTLFEEHIRPGQTGYDNMGVFQRLIRLLTATGDNAVTPEERNKLQSRFLKFCHHLRLKIELAQQAQREQTGKQAVKRVIKDFLVRHSEAAGVRELEVLLVRLDKETELLGEDGKSLQGFLEEALESARKMRSANQVRLSGEKWQAWRENLETIKKNPLAVTCKVESDGDTGETAQAPSAEGSKVKPAIAKKETAVSG